jgi:hypothetical protein
MAKRKTRRVRASVPASARDAPTKISNAQFKDLQSLVHGREKPTTECYTSAREIITRTLASGSTALQGVDNILFLLSTNLSVTALSGYATLDKDHIENIQRLISSIDAYSNDLSQKRPLNFLMLASPGAGKSHFIKRVADQLQGRKVSAITFNMTALQTNEDLIPALDAARNLKVEDKLPLLFLDEFDSKLSNIPLLLPLLWDGELNLGQRDLKLGRVIIVLAGSDPSLPSVMDHARSMRNDIAIQDGNTPKIVDLLSRINGSVVEIPPFYDPTRSVDRRADKACVAIQLLRQRFGETLRTVPRALLRFIVETEFRYGVRSIAHLIDLIPYKKEVFHLKLSDLKLPLQNTKTLKNSSLAYHLVHSEQVHGIVEGWKAAHSDDVQLPVLAKLDDFIPPWWWEELARDRHRIESMVRRIEFVIGAKGPVPNLRTRWSLFDR